MNIFEINVESFYQGMTEPYDSEDLTEEELSEDHEIEYEHEMNE